MTDRKYLCSKEKAIVLKLCSKNKIILIVKILAIYSHANYLDCMLIIRQDFIWNYIKKNDCIKKKKNVLKKTLINLWSTKLFFRHLNSNNTEKKVTKIL